MNTLGTLYQAQGRYAEADPLYTRSLAIRETALGPAHPDIGRSLNNLAQRASGETTFNGCYGAPRPFELHGLRMVLAAGAAPQSDGIAWSDKT